VPRPGGKARQNSESRRNDGADLLDQKAFSNEQIDIYRNKLFNWLNLKIYKQFFTIFK
jgi:hypothetical protein